MRESLLNGTSTAKGHQCLDTVEKYVGEGCLGHVLDQLLLEHRVVRFHSVPIFQDFLLKNNDENK